MTSYPLRAARAALLWVSCLLCPSAIHAQASEGAPAFAEDPAFDAVRGKGAPAAEHAPAEPVEAEHKKPARRSQVGGVGLAASLPEFGSETGGSSSLTASQREGGFTFHGFLRVPIRAGLGPQHDGSDGNQLHAPPRAPDMSFTHWEYTHNHPGAWVDLVMSYGNETASMTASIATRNPTIASFRNLQAQLGINTAFVSLDFPEAFGRYGGLHWDVGALSNRYGTAGKYNAGMYRTYLFGRTRVAGETLTARLGLMRDVELALEHGVGAKLDVIPFSTADRETYEPYSGPEPQGSTFVHHAHAALNLYGKFEVGGHYITTWSTDDRSPPAGLDGRVPPSQVGRITVGGLDLRFEGGRFGDGYVGFSRVQARDALSLADSLELLHSQGGWQFRNNFFGRFDPRRNAGAAEATGTVDTLLFQYQLSLGRILHHPARFWGQGPDLTLALFGMFNQVDHVTNAHRKLKWGTELIYKPLSVLALGARYDLVQPNLDDGKQSFSVFTPQLIIRTNFTGHEQVVLKYSRYVYGAEVYPVFPYDDIEQVDPHVFSVSANMWW